MKTHLEIKAVSKKIVENYLEEEFGISKDCKLTRFLEAEKSKLIDSMVEFNLDVQQAKVNDSWQR